MRNIFWILFLFLSAVSMADTPPPGTVKIRGGTDNTTIGNVADSLKVNLTNSITTVISGNTPVTQVTSPWVISGNTGRTLTLLNSTDSVNSFQGGSWAVGVNNFPTVIGVTQSTTPWIVNGSGFTQPVSGTVTANAGTGTFQTNVTNSTLAVTQSGLWSTGRTWTLSSGSDSVSASVSNFPVLQQVDLEKIVGASPSVTNYVPTRISNGTSYVDPTQIRALTATDVVTADQGGSWNVGQAGAWTVTANAGTGTFQTNVTNASIPVTQSGTWTVQQGSPPWAVLATQDGSWTTGRTWSLSSGTDSVNIGNFPATQAVTQSTSPWVVSGTVTANIGTTNGLALDATVSAPQGSVSGGTAGTTSELAGGVYSSIPPALTDGQQAAFQLDASGNLKTTATLTASSVTANQGTPNTLSNAWPVEVTDGTNVLGTSTHPIRNDPTGTTTQPVSGTVTADQGGSWTVASTQSGVWSTGRTWNLSSGSDSVAIGGTVGVTQSTSPWVVSGTVTANAGTGTFTVGQSSGANLHVDVDNFPATTAVTQSTSPWVVSGTVAVTQSTSPWVVSGTVTANAGTGTFNTKDSADGPVSPGTVATNSLLIGGQYNSPAITLTNGQQSAIQIDSSGFLLVDGSSVTQPISGTVTANQGTSPWVTSASQNGTWTVQQGGAPWSVSQSGLWTVTANAGTGTFTVGQSTGSNLHVDVDNFPATTAVTQSTSPWVVSGTVTANAGTGTFQTNVTNASIPVTQSGSWTVTANAGTNLNTSALALDTSVNGVLVSQGSTTSGESGPLVQGAVTTASPSYTTAKTNPLSLTTAGALRVDASATTQPVSGTVTANQGGSWTVAATQSGTWTVQPGNTANTTPWLATINQGGNSATVTASNALKVDGSAVTQPVSGTVTANQGTSPWVTSANITQVGGVAVSLGQQVMASSIPVTLSSNQSGINTFLDKSSSGTISAVCTTPASCPANSTVTVASNGMSSTIFTASGTWSATLVFEGFDGANWISTPGLTEPAGGITAAIVTNGTVIVNNGGYQQMRVRCSAYTSGSATIQMNAGAGTGLVEVYNDSGDPLVVKGNGTAGSPDSNVVTVQGVSSGTNLPVSQATASSLNAQVVGNIASGSADSGNGVKISGVYNTTVPSLSNGNRGDIQIDSRGAQQITQLDGSRQTYSASAVAFTAAATPTDVFTITGSASKTVRVTVMECSISTTVGGGILFNGQIVKRSTTDSGGTSVSVAAVPHDSNNAAATATVLNYTANPTLGTPVGPIRAQRVDAQSAAAEQVISYSFGNRPSQAVVLRNTTQVLAFNIDSTSVTGNVIDCYVEWTEE